MAMEMGMDTRMETGQLEMRMGRMEMVEEELRMVQAKMVEVGSMQVELEVAREIEARGVVSVV